MNRVLKITEIAAQPLIPRLEDVSPEYAKLLAKRADLCARKAGLIAALNEPEEVEDKSRVAELLGDVPPADESKKQARRQDREEQEMLLSDLEQALGVLDRRLSDERLKTSDEICRQIEPAYRGIIHDLCLKLVAANEANSRLFAFSNELNERGISWAQLQPMGCRFLGAPYSTTNPVSHYLRLAVAHGFISIAEVPKMLADELSPREDTANG